jgi:hypothetical protein
MRPLGTVPPIVRSVQPEELLGYMRTIICPGSVITSNKALYSAVVVGRAHLFHSNAC